jgi:thioredoxin 1
MNIITLTKDNFAAALEKDSLLLIDFWAEWCVPCRSFSKIVEEVAKKNPDVVFGKVNTEEEPELANEFNIRSIPTVMILRRKVVLFHEAGLLPTEAVQDLLNQAKKVDMDEVLKNLQQGEH